MFQRRVQIFLWIFQNPINNSTKVECWFVVIYLYIKSWAARVTVSQLYILEIYFACFSCSNKCNVSKSSIGLEGFCFFWFWGGFDFEWSCHNSCWFNPPYRRFTSIAFLLRAFQSKNISFANSNINCLSDNWARSTLEHFLLSICKRSPFNSNFISVSWKVAELAYKLVG